MSSATQPGIPRLHAWAAKAADKKTNNPELIRTKMKAYRKQETLENIGMARNDQIIMPGRIRRPTRRHTGAVVVVDLPSGPLPEIGRT